MKLDTWNKGKHCFVYFVHLNLFQANKIQNLCFVQQVTFDEQLTAGQSLGYGNPSISQYMPDKQTLQSAPEIAADAFL